MPETGGITEDISSGKKSGELPFEGDDCSRKSIDVFVL